MLGAGTDIIRSQWTPYQAFHQDIRTHVSESRFTWRGVFPPTCQKTDREGFYVNSGSAIPGHTLLLAHFPCMRYQKWDQGTWRLLPANIVQTLPAGEGLHGRLYLRNYKIYKMYEIQIYGTGYVFQFSVVWWRPFQSFKSLLACTH